MLQEAGYFLRMTRGWREFLRTPPACDPHALVRQNIEERETNFLGLARRVIFANPANPYHEMFRWAGCGYEELERSVRTYGLESTLGKLHQAGVFLSHDEFKGKQPIRRGGREIATDPRAFVNPLAKGTLETTSSGSRSTGTITRPSVEFQVYREAQEALFLEQFLNPPRVVGALMPILPSTVGLRRTASTARSGAPVEKWFTLGGSLGDSVHYRLLTALLVLESRMCGLRQPFPACLPANDFSPAARYIAGRRAEGEEVLFLAPVSFAVRVAAAALDLGLDIGGTFFISGAEPLTAAKRAVVESAGAAIFPRYGISELGWIGCACRQMGRENTVHIMRDSVAVISHQRQAPLSNTQVQSLLFTTLLPSSAHVLINVEMEDSGILEPARCDCPLKTMGLTEQLRDIYSFGKLTGQGITLVGGEMLSILECSLPARFGGAPGDYQLVEREGAAQTVTELRVSPRVRARNEEQVQRFFMAEVRKLWGGALPYRHWNQTGGVRVVFEEPIVSGGRKINALHLLGTAPGDER